MAAEATTAAADAAAERLPRPFWTLYTAVAVSSLGDGMLIVGLPLLAATLTGSPLSIAAVTLMQRLAQLALSLPAGALVDRMDARRVAVGTNVGQAVLMTGAGLLIWAGHFPLAALLALAFLTEAMAAFFNCTTVVVVGSVVPPSRLALANIRLRTTVLVTAFVAGPGLGGLVFATGRQLPVFIDAATFAAAALVLLSLRMPPRETAPAVERHLVEEIKEGVRISFGSPSLRLTALIPGVIALFQSGSVAVIVVLGTHTLALSKTAFGIALACGNVVAPLAILALPAIRRMSTARAVALGLVLGVAGELVLGTAAGAPQLSLGLALDATAVTITSTTLMTSRMRQVPREMLGRMAGGFATVMLSANVVGTMVGGLLARGNPRAPYLVCSAAIAVLLLAVLRRLPTLDGEPAAPPVIPAQSPGPADSQAAPTTGIP